MTTATKMSIKQITDELDALDAQWEERGLRAAIKRMDELANELRRRASSQHVNDRALKETYLGDGLYVSFDGYMFILRAPREDGVHWVALEPPELMRFVSFVAKTAREKADELEE